MIIQYSAPKVIVCYRDFTRFYLSIVDIPSSFELRGEVPRGEAAHPLPAHGVLHQGREDPVLDDRLRRRLERTRGGRLRRLPHGRARGRGPGSRARRGVQGCSALGVLGRICW